MAEAELGAFAKMSKSERLAWYGQHECHPTSDISAARLQRVQWLKQHNSDIPFIRVLDIGCHDGFVTRWLLNDLWDECQVVIGVDPCEAAITLAETQLDKVDHPEKAKYIVGSFEDFENGSEAYDVVVAFEFIEHITPEDVDKLLTIMDSHLAPGGRAFITTPDIDGPFGRTNPDPGHINLYSKERFLELIEKVPHDAVEYDEGPGKIMQLMWRKP